MRRPSPVSGLAVDVAWSLWRELGVPGPIRRHAGWLVVPEPLILYTAALGDRDRRLRDAAMAWCVTHMPVVSTRALRNAYTQERWGARLVADFTATIGVLTGARWPAAGVGHPFPVDLQYEGWPPPYGEPSQLTLRIRSLFGVGVRAEVLRVLLTASHDRHTLAELARVAMATKRQTTEAVEQLHASGVVSVDRSRQPHSVRLLRREPLQQLVGPLPAHSYEWAPLLRVLVVGLEALEEAATVPDDLAGAQLHRALRNHSDLIASAGVEPPGPGPPGTFAVRAHDWFSSLLQQAAGGAPVV